MPRTVVEYIEPSSSANGKLLRGDIIEEVTLQQTNDSTQHPARPKLMKALDNAGQQNLKVDVTVIRKGEKVTIKDLATMRVPGATLYSRICGATLARAHARWGDRIAIASYLGKGPGFDRAIARFAVAYADQTERDHAALVAAVRSGRLRAETEKAS